MTSAHTPRNCSASETGSNMRTTEELIEELHAKATGAFVAGIVVGFEKKTEFVWVNSPDPLGDLNALTKRGGEPIAVYRVDKSAGTLNCTFEPFEEYARESWVRAYLDSLGTGFMKLVEAQTGGKVTEVERNWPDLN